ncbi:MAG TPA: hypothetical protein DFJ59_06725 [Alphaproteobacteria bacterium]|nr:hypothetical protein [Alphaproteobacteria bacterium]
MQHTRQDPACTLLATARATQISDKVFDGRLGATVSFELFSTGTPVGKALTRSCGCIAQADQPSIETQFLGQVSVVTDHRTDDCSVLVELPQNANHSPTVFRVEKAGEFKATTVLKLFKKATSILRVEAAVFFDVEHPVEPGGLVKITFTKRSSRPFDKPAFRTKPNILLIIAGSVPILWIGAKKYFSDRKQSQSFAVKGLNEWTMRCIVYGAQHRHKARITIGRGVKSIQPGRRPDWWQDICRHQPVVELYLTTELHSPHDR